MTRPVNIALGAGAREGVQQQQQQHAKSLGPAGEIDVILCRHGQTDL
jgi:hypothetical protein